MLKGGKTGTGVKLGCHYLLVFPPCIEPRWRVTWILPTMSQMWSSPSPTTILISSSGLPSVGVGLGHMGVLGTVSDLLYDLEPVPAPL